MNNKKKLKKKKTNNTLISVLTLIVLVGITAVFIFLSGRNNPDCDHIFGRFKTSIAETEFTVGEKIQTCLKCGKKNTEKVNATIDIPQLYLNGDISLIAKDSSCTVEADYFDGDFKLNAHATIKYQGHTSMAFDKKNYTIKFYKDNTTNEKYSFSLNGWDETSKYCLKANYIDHSAARNIVSSNIWSEVVASRKNLDANIAELDLYGGIDGFPFALFINDKYQGLYTFNIPKDEDTYNIADEENEAMFIINSGFSDTAKFKALITETDNDDEFELEYAYPDNDAQWPFESMNRLIDFVMRNDGEAFRKDIGKYLDVDAAIDYLITAYVLGATDNFSKNMILITYDGQKWIPNMYDLDTAGGLAFDGTAFFEPDFSVPQISQDGTISSGTENLLWDRILTNYTDEFRTRYNELRKNILSTENIIKRYSDFISSVPPVCYETDIELYPDIPFGNTNHTEQITSFIKSRCDLLDSIISNI